LAQDHDELSCQVRDLIDWAQLLPNTLALAVLSPDHRHSVGDASPIADRSEITRGHWSRPCSLGKFT
jgi:hypothetical protein